MAPCVPEAAQTQARPEQPIPRGPWPFPFLAPWLFFFLHFLFPYDVPKKSSSIFLRLPLPPAFAAPLVVRAVLSFGSSFVVLLLQPFVFLVLAAARVPGALPCFYRQTRSCVYRASMRLSGINHIGC